MCLIAVVLQAPAKGAGGAVPRSRCRPSLLPEIVAFCDVDCRRYLLRELVVQYLTKQFPKWTAIDKALETGGWRVRVGCGLWQ